MSLLERSPLQGFRDAGDLNATLDLLQIDTASTLVDGTNFREEGLDRGAFDSADRHWAQQAFLPLAAQNAALHTFAVPTTLVMGAVQFRTGAITLVAGDILRVRAQAFLTTVPGAAPGIPAASIAAIQLQDNVTGPGTTAIASSLRKRGTDANGAHASMTTWASWVGPLALNWVELVAWEVAAGAQLQFANTVMMGVIFKRVS